MRRMIVWLLLIAGLSAVGLFLADSQGTVTLEWLGYRIITRTSLLIAAIGIVFLFSIWIVTLTAQLWEMPERRRNTKRYARQQIGLHALTQAATAMAMSNNALAFKEIRRAQRYLENAPLTLLMEAQWYDKQGQSAKALPLYQELSTHEETAQLGVRGLLQTAERSGDFTKALNLAEEASKQFPKDVSLFTHTIELMLHEKRCDEAIAMLSAWRGHWRVSRDVRLQYLALAYTIKALTLPAEERGVLLEKAYAMQPRHPYIPLALLASYGATQHTRMKSLLMQVWQQRPSPALTALSLQWLAEQPDDKRAKLVRKLTKYAPDHLESAILHAYDAEARSQLAEAHGALEKAISVRESRRALTLMAEIESELSGTDKAKPWFTRAASAPVEEQWLCKSCGHASHEWSAFCPRCNAMDAHEITLASHAITSIEIVGGKTA